MIKKLSPVKHSIQLFKHCVPGKHLFRVSRSIFTCFPHVHVYRFVLQSSELYEYLPGTETAEVLYRVAHILCCHLKEKRPLDGDVKIDSLSQSIQDMASQALTFCSPGKINSGILRQSSY